MMKNERTLVACGARSALVLGLLLANGCDGLCEIDKSCEPGRHKPPNTREEALEKIDAWMQALVAQAGGSAVQLSPLQSSEPGDIWIRCDRELKNRVGTVLDRAAPSQPPQREHPLIESSVSFEWARSFHQGLDLDVSIDTGVKLLDVGLKAAFTSTEASFVKVTLGLEDTAVVEFDNPETVYQTFVSSIADVGTPANSLVTGVLKGRVSMAYEFLDEHGKALKIEARLSTEINALDDVSAEYVQETSAEEHAGEVRESGDRPTVFAVLTRAIEAARVLDDERQEVCLSDDQDSLRTLVVQGTEGPLVQVRIEQGLRDDSGSHWFVDLENLSEEMLDGQVVLSIRSPYGQIVQRLYIDTTLSPGGMSHAGPPEGYLVGDGLDEAIVEAAFDRM